MQDAAVMIAAMKSQRGNVLFLILIAVALFAALSYAVTQSGRGGGTAPTKIDALSAASIVDAVTDVRTAAQRMMIMGTSPADIVLFTHNPDEHCTSGVNCLFASEGGGATWPSFPSSIAAMVQATNVSDGINVSGTSAADAGVIVFGVSETVCRSIDRGLGMASIPVPDANFADDPNNPVITQGEPNPSAACIDISAYAADLGADPPIYVYYQVVIEQ